jgi:periplasmic divalent cation tolerance protein
MELEPVASLAVLSVTTTVGSLEAARTLARAIVERRLAACVQLDAAVSSLYRWQGDLREEQEIRIVIKTVPACAAALQAFFAAEHPYGLPQFLATIDQASAAYAQWVRDEVVVPTAP